VTETNSFDHTPFDARYRRSHTDTKPFGFMKPPIASNDWGDSDTDLEDYLNRVSHASDPESVDGNINRRLSPSLMKTIESWDFASAPFPALVLKSSPSTDVQGGILRRSDLYRLRMLDAPASSGKQQGMARSLPSSGSSYVPRDWAEDGLRRSTDRSTHGSHLLGGQSSPRTPSQFRGYDSDGDS
jgi:hypothetical protein